ncbi:MAG TPA: flagellar biosynthetic protein FliQ [Bryobacteraceae bacterium]|nr:flagellar biosynthetic protein FliQ [Bryobacteraceae bacterium]
MTQQFVVQLFRDALMTTFWLCLPILLVGFLAGVVISLLQIVTSMQDSAFSTVPRLAAFLAALLLFLPWMLTRLIAWTSFILGDFSRYVR